MTRLPNPSNVLLLYRDQLDAQTSDQVIICKSIWFYINFIHVDIKVIDVNGKCVGLIAVIHWRVVDQLPDICLADQDIWCTMSLLICSRLLSGIVQSESYTSLDYIRRYLQLALTSNSYIEWMHMGDNSVIGRLIMLRT